MKNLIKDILFFGGIFVGTFLVVLSLAFASAIGMGMFDGSFYGEQ